MAEWKGGAVLFAGGTDWTQVRIVDIARDKCWLFHVLCAEKGP